MMTTIKETSDLMNLSDGNKFIGDIPELNKCTINFNGSNNILFCESGTKMESCTINFNGDNSVVYIGGGCHTCRINVSLYTGCMFHLGKNNYFNNPLMAILSSNKHCYIGDDCLFSTNISIRNSDPHLVYDCNSMERINPVKSVFLGDHVWIGQDCIILKDTQIDSGAIIGAGAVVAGKKIGYNSSWAGNPSKLIKEGIFWDKGCVHKWNSTMVKRSQSYEEYAAKHRKDISPDAWIYSYNKEDSISFNKLDKELTKRKSADDKLQYILELENSKTKNRFAHKQQANKSEEKKVGIKGKIIKALKKIIKKLEK